MPQVTFIETMERAICRLYSNKAAFERLLYNAGMELPALDFDGNYNAAVSRCFRQAEGQPGKLGDIVEAALRDYKGNPELLSLAGKLGRSLAVKAATSAEELRGFLDLLRECRHLTRRELSRLYDELRGTADVSAMEESDRGGADIADAWYDLGQKLQYCMGQVQLYRVLLAAAANPAHRRVPGGPVRRTLAEVAADEATLIDYKLELFKALTVVVQSCQDLDRNR